MSIAEKIVDSNEPSSIREKLLEVGWTQQRLVSGDFSFYSADNKRVGITRKSVSDLLSSIGERFGKQMEELLDYYDICIMVLEGNWRLMSPYDKIITGRGIEHFTWDTVWNYLHRWFAKGFIPELTVNEGHTIHRLNVLYALYQKPFSMSGSSREYADDRVMAFPSGTRGQTAIECLKRFGSLGKVADVGTEILKTVNGVGDKKAEMIWRHFNKQR